MTAWEFLSESYNEDLSWNFSSLPNTYHLWLKIRFLKETSDFEIWINMNLGENHVMEICREI